MRTLFAGQPSAAQTTWSGVGTNIKKYGDLGDLDDSGFFASDDENDESDISDDDYDWEEQWEQLRPTFTIMMQRALMRGAHGRTKGSVMWLSCIMIGAVILLLTFGSVVGSMRIPHAYMVQEDRECKEFANVDLKSPYQSLSNLLLSRSGPTDPRSYLECGQAVANQMHCSHVYVWKPGMGCKCCKFHTNIPLNATKLLIVSKKWDAYVFWYQTRDAAEPWHGQVQIMLGVAIVATTLSVTYLWYACRYFDNVFFHAHMVSTTVFCVWLIYAQFDPGKQPFLWKTYTSRHGITVIPSRKEVLIVFTYVIVELLICVVNCSRTCCCRRLITCCDGSMAKNMWRVQKAQYQNQVRNQYRFSYRPVTSFQWKRCNFWYEGEKDELGKPHGMGKWFDESFHGECLIGLWEHGEPRGPFHSRETGTSALFLQGCVGYVASRGDCLPGELAKGGCFFNIAEQRCGFVVVECSVAGGFFPFLPRINYEHGVNEENLDDSTEEELDVHSMIDRVREKIEAVPRLVHHDVVNHDTYYEEYQIPQSPPVELEAIVFVHGWASDMETALTKLSLMLLLGKVPSNFIPIVFGWSCGNVPAFFYVKNHSLEYAEDFKKLFNALGATCKKCHVICHSMGCQVWCKNVDHIMEQCFFENSRVRRSVDYSRKPGDHRMFLGSVILMNAEVLVEEFLEAAPKLMNHAERLTMYIDTTDIACMASEFFQRILPWSCQQWRDPERGVQRTRVVGPHLSSYTMAIQKSDHRVRHLQGDLVEKVLPKSEIDRYIEEERPEANELKVNVRGIEIIDCTHLSANAGFSRHNYWGLNTLMAEDIVAVISKQRPASERAHLVKRNGNVYDFLSPPSSMKA